MSTCIRYKISNSLKVDNAAFCKPSDINPITGNPIYRDSFTHSDETVDYVEKLDPKYSDGYGSFIVEHVYGKENPNPEPLPDGLELY